MSMEMHVFFCGKLPSKSALQKAMRELGFPLSIKPARGSLEKQNGYMPMVLGREDETGVEFDVFDGRAAVEEYTTEVDPRFDRSANFRWGGDMQEMAVAFCSAAALASLTGGIVFEDTEAKLLSVDETITIAREYLASVVEPEEQRRPGTRPSDVKRYLAPLLKMRGDLVLHGRLLLIRPVRHLVRGAFFDRTGDKYTFQIWRHISPLYDERNGVGYSGDSRRMAVWQPHFEPLLFDTLDHNILGRVARLVSLTDFADEIDETGPYMKVRVQALILAGERERAAACIETYRHSFPRDATYWNIAEERALLDRDISSVCEEYRRREAKNAKELKLEGVWEPTPFPAELPPARRSEAHESLFQTKPWIARPEGLFGAAPEQPGTLQFSKSWLRQGNRPAPFAPISRADAEELHRNHKSYCIFARLVSGEIVVVQHIASWDTDDPSLPPVKEPIRTANIYVHVLRASYELLGHFWESVRAPGILTLWNVNLHAYDRKKRVQYTSVFHDDREISFERWEEGHQKRELTDEEMAAYRMPIPAFGAFEELLRAMNMCLRLTGLADAHVALPEHAE